MDSELLALAGANQLGDDLAEVRLLDLLEPASAIFRWISPRIRGRAHEGAHWLAVAEIDPVHRDDLVDDAGKLARGLRAFHL